VEVWEAPIWESARKHGVRDADIRHVLRNILAQTVDLEDAALDLFLGPDFAANLIEVGVLNLDDGPLIIHAMPARLQRFFPTER
jgi:hypothetical protein